MQDREGRIRDGGFSRRDSGEGQSEAFLLYHLKNQIQGSAF